MKDKQPNMGAAAVSYTPNPDIHNSARARMTVQPYQASKRRKPTITFSDRVKTHIIERYEATEDSDTTASEPQAFDHLLESEIEDKLSNLGIQRKRPVNSPILPRRNQTRAPERLIKQFRHFGSKLPHQIPEAQIGFIAYIGPPEDGHIVIGNPEKVDQWLQHSREAIETNRIKVHNNGLSVSELEKIYSITLLPGNRHEFHIKYDIHPQMSCPEHRHDKRIWESPKYPSQILSCACFDTQ